jgi:phosphoribosylanthranilate isomerase
VKFVKICGITRREDAHAAISFGANALGFVFWPKSPRYVEPAEARKIVDIMIPSIVAVGVFVNQPADEVNRIANEVGLRAIQLHGDESNEYVAQMSRDVIKAIPVGVVPVRPVSKWPAPATILLDVHDPVRKGGTGHVIDWVVAHDLARLRPIILAGGLTPENVGDAIERVRPYGIDVSSGVESSPGIKDHRRLKALFEAVHGSHHATRS